jgi:hypothetical protein
MGSRKRPTKTSLKAAKSARYAVRNLLATINIAQIVDALFQKKRGIAVVVFPLLPEISALRAAVVLILLDVNEPLGKMFSGSWRRS